jgi:signal-transduction protein with cAMP-binding, CBS, and nucleotidyltransferase domain
MKTGITVHDAMTTRPIQVLAGSTIGDCAKLMAEKKIGSVLVNSDSGFVGILTDQDMTRKVVAMGVTSETNVEQVMSEEVLTITGDKDIFEALGIMRDAEIRHLPVLDGKKLIGFVTMKDILKLQPDLFDIVVDKFELAESERKLANRK